jgi:hypothetical protein
LVLFYFNNNFVYHLKIIFNCDQRGVKRHYTVVGGWMHSRKAEIADLVGEHLQTKEKTKMGGRW